MWITNGGIADVAVVWAQTDDGIRGLRGPDRHAGLHTRDIHRKLSLRASITSELILEDVPAARQRGAARRRPGMRGPLSCLTEARFGICWGAVGAGTACYLAALEYAKTRVQYGKPIAALPAHPAQARRHDARAAEGAAAGLAARRAQGRGRAAPASSQLGKLNNVRIALEVAREARTILGANGITTEYPVMRHANNLESVLTYEGTTEIHTLILGEALTGERALA